MKVTVWSDKWTTRLPHFWQLDYYLPSMQVGRLLATREDHRIFRTCIIEITFKIGFIRCAFLEFVSLVIWDEFVGMYIEERKNISSLYFFLLPTSSFSLHSLPITQTLFHVSPFDLLSCLYICLSTSGDSYKYVLNVQTTRQIVTIWSSTLDSTLRMVREGFKKNINYFHGIFDGGVPLPPPPSCAK